MNILSRARAKLSPNLCFPSPSPRKLLYNNTPHPIPHLQRCNFYSTKTPNTRQKTQQRSTKAGAQEHPPTSAPIPKQTGIVWPKPREIPFQAKVANSVNLIGYVKNPVQFESAPDEKHFAVTVVSQEISGGKKESLLIPVVFEGDLAHVVAAHVKKKDCVLVSGQLCAGKFGVVSSESFGGLHLVAENINFVEGFVRSGFSKKPEVSFASVGTDEVQVEKVGGVDKDEDFSRQWKDALDHAKGKSVFPGEKDGWGSSVSVGSSVEPSLNVDHEGAKMVNGELEEEKGSERSGYTANKTKNRDRISALWSDLEKNSLQWWDYRNHKSNGLVKENYPDFRQKVTGESLWLDSAPTSVLDGLDKMEFDVKDFKVKLLKGGEDSWKNLVENPDKWWDNRVGKKNPRSPDFKHKETGQGLWMDRAPGWALSRLPPSKNGQNTV